MRAKRALIDGDAAVVIIGAAAWIGRDVYAEARIDRCPHPGPPPREDAQGRE